MLETPEKIRELQRKLYQKAKQENCESHWKKMTGKPYSRKLNVRFEEGELEIGHSYYASSLLYPFVFDAFFIIVAAVPGADSFITKIMKRFILPVILLLRAIPSRRLARIMDTSLWKFRR